MTAIVPFLTDSSTNGNGPSTASVTHMMTLGHTNEAMSSFSQSTGSDPCYEEPIGVAGTFNNYQANMVVNPRTSTTTFGLAKAGVTQNSTVSFGSGATGVQKDSTHSDSASVADLWSQYYTTGTGAGAVQGGMSTQFHPSSGTAFLQTAAGTGTAYTAASVNYFQGVGGVVSGSNVSTTEAGGQALVTVGGTASYYHAGIQTNSRSTATTVNLRDNTADAGPTVTFGAGATGMQTDSTHTATLTVNDLVTNKIAMGSGSGSIVWNLVGYTYVSAVDGAVWTPSLHVAPGASSSSAGFSAPLGDWGFIASQANASIQTGVASSTWKNMVVDVASNSSGTTTTYTFNLNNADKTGTVSFSAAATGRQQDSTHSDTSSSGTDNICIHQTGLNASVFVQELGFEMDVPVLAGAAVGGTQLMMGV